MKKDNIEYEEEMCADCTSCGRKTELSQLRFLPEAETAAREYALARFARKGEQPAKFKDGLDYDTLLCPQCYQRWLEKNGK